MAIKRKGIPSNTPGDHLAIRYFRLGSKLKRMDFVTENEFAGLAAEFRLLPTSATWYKSIQLATEFEEESPELLELCRMQVGGRHITLSHLDELIRLPNARQRKRFAAKTLRGNLSCLALRAEIRDTVHWTSKRSGAGRKRREPNSRAEAIWRVNREINQLKSTLEWLATYEQNRSKLRKEITDSVAALARLQNVLGRLLGVT
ncbi:hypothetical protein [Schlesneria sp. T3-172]|uniref:hypothetical protein n=1 Tax=Schlesneria sphaerica TaxID=3373610 RepID=UPI0037C59F12